MTETLLNIGKLIDEPLGDPSFILTYLITKRIKSDGFKVILSGDGGDELFFGYDSYEQIRNMERKYKNIYRIAKLLMSIYRFKANSFLGYMVNIFSDKRAFIYGLSSGKSGWYARKALKRNKSDISFDDLISFISFDLDDNIASFTELQNEFDKKVYLPDDILFKLDRTSMRNSIESRVPLLDYTLVDLTSKIPNTLHYKNERKSILKNLLKKYKKDYSENEKRGFSFDINLLLKEEVVRIKLVYFSEHSYVSNQGLFDPVIIANLIEEYYKIGRGHERFLWNFLAFQLWYDSAFINNRY